MTPANRSVPAPGGVVHRTGSKKQARESYGTDSLEELRKKLEEMKHENDRKRSDYQSHLDEIERQLADVERQHAEAVHKESQS